MPNWIPKHDVRQHAYASDLHAEVNASPNPDPTAAHDQPLIYTWKVTDRTTIHGPFTRPPVEGAPTASRHQSTMGLLIQHVDAYASAILRARVEAPDANWTPSNHGSTWRKFYVSPLQITAVVHTPLHPGNAAHLVLEYLGEEVLNTSVADTTAAMVLANDVVPMVGCALAKAYAAISDRLLASNLSPATIVFGNRLDVWVRRISGNEAL